MRKVIGVLLGIGVWFLAIKGGIHLLDLGADDLITRYEDQSFLRRFWQGRHNDEFSWVFRVIQGVAFIPAYLVGKFAGGFED